MKGEEIRAVNLWGERWKMQYVLPGDANEGTFCV